MNGASYKMKQVYIWACEQAQMNLITGFKLRFVVIVRQFPLR